MRRGYARRATFTVAAFCFVGCATIMHGTSQSVSFSTRPTGATIIVDGQDRGKTPAIIDLKRKDHHIATINLDGYEPYEIPIRRGVSSWVVGNLVFGMLPGLAVDAISGGLYKLTPAEVGAELSAAGQSTRPEDGTLYIGVVLAPKDEWERIGTLTRSP